MRKIRRCVFLPCFVCSMMNTSNRVTTFLLLSLVSLVLYTVWLQVETVDFKDYSSSAGGAGAAAGGSVLLWSNGRWETVSGPRPGAPGRNLTLTRVTKSKHCNIYNISRPINADFMCVDMKTKPKAKVCLYETWRDKFVSHDLAHTGLWEPHVLFDFQDVLRRDSSLAVIDIGANIGVYTVLAAAMGHQVIAVEPYRESIYRIHQAANLSQHTDKITIVENAVSDVRGQAIVIQSGDNQGDTRIQMGYRPCVGSCPDRVSTILLDDLLEVITFNRAVIKIDSQGYEHRTFKHCSALLDAVDVPYIYMEWALMAEMYMSANHTSADKTMVLNMMKLLLNRNYRPYMLDAHGARVLDPNTWGAWPFDVVWRLKPNKKEYGKLLSNHFRIWP